MDSTDWVKVKERKRKKSTESSKSSMLDVHSSQVKRGRAERGNGSDITKKVNRPVSYTHLTLPTKRIV